MVLAIYIAREGRERGREREREREVNNLSKYRHPTHRGLHLSSALELMETQQIESKSRICFNCYENEQMP